MNWVGSAVKRFQDPSAKFQGLWDIDLDYNSPKANPQTREPGVVERARAENSAELWHVLTIPQISSLSLSFHFKWGENHLSSQGSMCIKTTSENLEHCKISTIPALSLETPEPKFHL